MRAGTLTQAARDAMCDDFIARPVLFRGMSEVKRVWWVRMQLLRQLCVGISDPGKASTSERTVNPNLQTTSRCDEPRGAFRATQEFSSSLLPPGLKLRPFLLGTGWMGAGGLWDNLHVQHLIDTGTLPDDWLRLQDTPRLSAALAAHLKNILADTAAKYSAAAASSAVGEKRARCKSDS